MHYRKHVQEHERPRWAEPDTGNSYSSMSSTSQKRRREDDEDTYSFYKRHKGHERDDYPSYQSRSEYRHDVHGNDRDYASYYSPPSNDHRAYDEATSAPAPLPDGALSWKWMAGHNYLDAPIQASSHKSSTSQRTDNLQLYVDKGSAYSTYLSSTLPKDDLESVPSEGYLETTQESPNVYSASSVFAAANAATLPQRQMVVLDLNGSLLYRSKASKTFNGTKTRAIARRPYVRSLAQYLAHERTTNTLLIEQRQKKRKYYILPPNFDTLPSQSYKKKKGKRKNKQRDDPAPLDGSMTPETTDYLRKKIKSHPERFTLLAPLDAMIWSSVQPQNLLGMVDAAFGTEQSALKACWTRSMLGLGQDGYHNKVQTTKNLERIWWSSDNEYGTKTTLLIDDTALKARLQPCNLLQISEYTQTAASAARSKSNDAAHQAIDGDAEDPQAQPEDATDEPEKDGEKEVDTTLLAVIGILEEMRAQTNIPAWIRSGGLWGDVPISERGELESSVPEVVPVESTDKSHGHEEASSPPPEGENPTPLWCMNPSVLSYWSKKGLTALRSRSITTGAGTINTNADVLQSLRMHGS